MSAHANTVILVGGFSEVIELAEACGKQIVGLIDPHLCGKHFGYPVLGNDPDARAIHDQYPDVPAFISVDAPEHRATLAALYAQHGFQFTSLIHPRAQLSRTATHGVGVMVQYGAHLSTSVSIADHVRINVYANVMHDVRVGSYTTIGPNAVVLGRVTIDERCYIGTHATILPELAIGARACVGAHANVTKSVAPGTVVVGNPARSTSSVSTKAVR